jgi:hypothetical protein
MDEEPMRVRPTRTTLRRLSGSPRRPHSAPRPVAGSPELPAEPVVDNRAERRARASGGPIDRAQYSCPCGYLFEAAVSTSVACPRCGTGQAW